MSAGESIHKTLPTAIRNLKNITRIYVIVEDGIYKITEDDSEFLMETKNKIQDAIKRVEEISAILKIPYNRLKIDEISLESVRDEIIRLYYEFPDAEFSLNITGGTTKFSIALFSVAIWINASVCITPNEEDIEFISIPKMHVKDLSKNVNYITILKLLKSRKNGISRTEMLRILNGSDNFRYVPLRNAEGDSKKRKLSRSGLLNLLGPLKEWELIKEEYKPNSKKELIHYITEDGLFALKFLDYKNSATQK
jgi:hypothetical protein